MTALRDPLLACARVAETADAARERDRATLAVLYAQHAASIHRFLQDLLGDRALAADATQETFVRAFGRLDSLRDGARIAPWLFGVARNISFELRKARYRARRVFAPEGEAHDAAHASGCASPEAELLGNEAARVVSTALSQLSEDRRAVLLLRLDHGLAYEEIAELMEWSLAKVKVEIHRAREVLRASLASYEDRGAK